jgi:predicted permease
VLWGRKRERDADLDHELRCDLELEAEEQREKGLSPDQAKYAARRAFGNTSLIKEETRQVWEWVSLERLLQDARFSLRLLRKSPGFVVFATLALALGLGANVAVFSVVDAVLLRPLAFSKADRLVEVWEDGSRIGFPMETPAPANYVDWKRRNHVFEDMAALKGDLYALTGEGTPEQVEGNPATANLFPLLGVSPLLGRTFSSDEDRPVGPQVVVIGYGLWQRRFGADREMVGREILLNGQKFTVIGVMPRGITFPERSDLWVPLGLSPTQLATRDNHYLRVVARLKPGVELAQAQREMAALAAQLAHDYPETNTNLGVVVNSLRDQLVGDLKPALHAVAVAAGFVLLITCANLAGLMLARGIQRKRELAVRVALGAGRARLIRQMLVESLMLGTLGGMAGIAIAVWATPFLRHLVPLSLTTWSEPKVDQSALAFLFFVSVTASSMFGMLPAFVLSKGDMSGLQRGGRAGIGGGTRWLRALIVSEVAIAAVLLIGAGLLTKTLWGLSHSPLGFEPAGVLTMRTSLPLTSDSRYRSFIARSQFFSQALKRVASLPGVISAGYTTFLPLTNGGGTSGFVIEGAAPPPLGQINDANHRVISPDYLQTLNVRLRAGRFFRESDTPDAPPVAIVNEAMARQYLPGRNPLGRRFRVDGNAPWITIVGVVDDIRQMSLDLKSRPEVYFPYTQPVGSYGYFTPRDLAVRVEGDPISYAATVQREIWAVDRNQPVADVMPMEQLIAEKLESRYAAVRLIGAFAGLGLLLAALGLYGLLAYSVVQRRSEIGVRMALGAQPRQVLRAVVAEGFRLVLCGLIFGAAGSWFVMRGLRSLLYGVAPTDIRIFIGSALVLLFVGAIASYLPAHRAAVIEPLEALGHE